MPQTTLAKGMESLSVSNNNSTETVMKDMGVVENGKERNVKMMEKGAVVVGETVHRYAFHKEQVEEYIGESVDEYVSMEIVQQSSWFNTVSRYVAKFGTGVKRLDLHGMGFHGDEEDFFSDDDCCDGDDDASDKNDEMDGKQLHFGISAGVCRVAHAGKSLVVVKNFVGNPDGCYWKTTMHFFVKKCELVLESGEEADAVEFFEGFVKAASKWVSSKDKVDGSFKLYRYIVEGSHGYWENDGTRKGRPINSIVMDNGVPERLEADLNRFLRTETRQFYYKHGIPYRRSYLFYGPPGSGKSSMIKALATRHKRSVSILTLAHPQMTDQTLADAVRSLNRDTILVLEDVDCLFAATAVSKEERTMEGGVQLTFSGVLNVLDGLSASWSATLTIMTTNHYEKLNPALIRAGRVDRKFNFPKPSRSQIEKFFLSFYPDASKALTSAFADKVESFSMAQTDVNSISIAVLQQLMIFFMDSSAQEVVDRAGEFFAEFFPDESASPSSSIYT